MDIIQDITILNRSDSHWEEHIKIVASGYTIEEFYKKKVKHKIYNRIEESIEHRDFEAWVLLKNWYKIYIGKNSKDEELIKTMKFFINDFKSKYWKSWWFWIYTKRNISLIHRLTKINS